MCQGASRGAEDGVDEVETEVEYEELVSAALRAALLSKSEMLTRAGSIAPSSPKQAQTICETSSILSSAESRKRT